MKALKTTLILYGGVGFLFGLSYLIIPRQAIAIQGFQGVAPAYLVATKMTLGASMIAVTPFVVNAARDPIGHILWVNSAIVIACLFFGVALYTGFVLYSDVTEALFGMIIHSVFAIALLVFYPRRKAHSVE